MAVLSPDWGTASLEVASALRTRILTLPNAGTWHTYLRFAENMNHWKKLFEFRDERDNKRKTRGGMIIHRGFEPLEAENTECQPVRCLFDILFLMANEDEQRRARTPLEGTNSSDEFINLTGAFLQSINNDNGLGYTNLSMQLPTIFQDADTEPIDGELCNTAVYRAEAILYS